MCLINSDFFPFLDVTVDAESFSVSADKIRHCNVLDIGLAMLKTGYLCLEVIFFLGGILNYRSIQLQISRKKCISREPEFYLQESRFYSHFAYEVAGVQEN